MIMRDENWKKPLPQPLPHVAPVPQTGWHFFKTKPGASWNLARRDIIPTIATGTRNKQALPRVLAARLERDPKDGA
jgi:hypothetical protein